MYDKVLNIPQVLYLGFKHARVTQGTHFLRVSGKSSRNNATSTVLSSTTSWYALSQTFFKLVAQGNNEEKDKI